MSQSALYLRSAFTFRKPSPLHSSCPWLAIRDSWCFLACSKSREKMTDVIWWLGLIRRRAVTDAGKSVVYLTSSLPYYYLWLRRAQAQVKLMMEKTLSAGSMISWGPGRRCYLAGTWWIKHKLSTNGNERWRSSLTKERKIKHSDWEAGGCVLWNIFAHFT